MIIGMIGLALSGFISGLFQNNLALYFALFSLGIFYGFFSLSRHSYMTQIVPSGYRGKAFSRFGGINRIGWFLVQLLEVILQVILAWIYHFI